jgi:hypothetical protein
VQPREEILGDQQRDVIIWEIYIFCQFKARVPHLTQCSLYSVQCTGGGGGCVSGTLASNSEKTARPKYNDDISVLISQCLTPGETSPLEISEPGFLKILKCNLGENASAGFQFNCLDFSNDTTFTSIYRHLGPFPGLLKFIQKNLFYQLTKTVACRSPVVLFDL